MIKVNVVNCVEPSNCVLCSSKNLDSSSLSPVVEYTYVNVGEKGSNKFQDMIHMSCPRCKRKYIWKNTSIGEAIIEWNKKNTKESLLQEEAERYNNEIA